MIRLVILSLLSLIFIVFFNQINTFSVNLGFSWTFSKILPYLILLILGMLLLLRIRKFLIFKSQMLVKVVLFGVLILPFTIGFILHPIYEGDFSREGTELTAGNSLSQLRNVDLIVLTIPSCPFCHESTRLMSVFQKRNPDLKIKYIVCSGDSESTKELRAFLPESIKIQKAKDLDKLLAISEGKFPTFIKVEKNKAVYKWSNNQFGVRALDWVESSSED